MVRPTLLNSCAYAATAAETRYRIDAPVDLRRVTRMIALDDAAAVVVRNATEPRGASFLMTRPETSVADDGEPWGDLVLTTSDGELVHLSAELEDADSVVMVATGGDHDAARAIGEAAALRGVMTAGLVFGPADEVRGTVASLRPYARVLLVSRSEDDLGEILTALRA